MPTGMTTAYDLTVGQIVDVDTSIYMVSPDDSPLITGTGADGLSVLSVGAPLTQIEFSWQHDELLTPRTTLNGAVTTGDAFITIATGDRVKFSTGDMLIIHKAAGTEYVRVTGYGTTADTLLVSRGYDGTTATNYASGATVMGLGTALPEGSDPENARTSDREMFSNYTQIFGPTMVEMSQTQLVVPRYGVPSEWSHQMYKRTVEQVIHREQTLLYGRKTNSTTTKIRTMGGIFYYIADSIDSTSTQLTVLNIQARQQVNYNAGGLPDRLIANPASLIDLNDINNTSIIRTEMVDTKRGRMPVSVVWTEFGPLTIVRNRWIHPSDAALIRREGVQRRVMRPFQMVPLAVTGDSKSAHIVCEESVQVKGQEHMSAFTGLGY